MTDLSSFTKTDLVDDHVADDVNVLIAAALRPEYANTQTITGTKELSDNDCQFQFITASGADRTVELSPEATSNHVTIIYNSGSSNNVVVKDDSGTYTFATLAPDEWRMFLPLNAEGWREWHAPTRDYKLSPTVSSNNLTLTLTHMDGTAPTVYRPIEFIINGTRRQVTAATSFTVTAGTNYFNAGGTDTATQTIELFAIAVWDSNSSIVALSAARVPYGRLVSDFSNTTTSNRYLFNYANFTSTDDLIVIGRFAATNSGTASYNWSVPTYTNLNLIQHPIYESNWLVWTPTLSGWSANPTVSCMYRVDGHTCWWSVTTTATGTSNNTATTLTLPFTSFSTHAQWMGGGRGQDNSSEITPNFRIDTSVAVLDAYKHPGNTAWTASGTKFFNSQGSYRIA
jgi:hypothetical protein